jgi:hypothetical protein
MPPRLTWSNLIPGLIALTVIVIVVGAVLYYGGVGKVRGDTVRIHVLTDQARGLMPGSDVWLDGQNVGVVHHIGFRVPSADTLHRVVIAADVKTEAAAKLRDDSRISVRAGGNVIGPVVVFMESGTPSGSPVRAGDTLRALGQTDAEVLMERAVGATKHLPTITADAKTVIAQTRNPDGTVGAFLTRGMPPGFGQLKAQVAALRGGSGGAPEGARGQALRREAASVMARVDSIRALLASPNTSFGRFRRDSTLPRAITELRADLDSLQASIAAAPGTLTRLRTDSALTWSIADARREMALLLEDMKRRPLRYINF